MLSVLSLVSVARSDCLGPMVVQREERQLRYRQ